MPREISANTPRTSITVQGLSFEASIPYGAGPVELTAGEASALNQTRVENLRNNFASTVKKAKEEFAKANNMAEEDVTAEHLDAAALQREFDQYDREYEFGIRRVGGGDAGRTPVEREARKIAREKVIEALKSKNIKVNSVSAEKMEELVSGLAGKEPIIKEAQRRVNNLTKIALDEIDLGGTSEQAEAA